MGSACCVAARDRTITDHHRSGNGEVVVVNVGRNDRYSPSWSFRWDHNRGRVAGEEEESSMNSFSHGVSVSTNDRLLDNKSHTSTVEEGSPLDSSRSLTWHKSSPSGEIGFHQSDQLNSKNLPEGKESMGTPVTSDLSPTKTSTPPHSTSSLSASPLSSSQSHLPPLSTLTPSRWPRHHHNHNHHHLRQVSDSRIRGIMSPNFSISEDGSPSPFPHPGWSHKSTRGSHGGSSDNSSEPTYSELMAIYNNSKRWSFDSESLSFSRDRVSRWSSGRVSSSPSVDVVVQPCGVCSKLLTERSYCGAQKLAAGVAATGLPVVAVLVCGHVYHAECLENMTPEVDKYDPACPVCTFGEKKVLKLTEKARGEMDLKGKIGKLRRRVVDGGDSVLFENRMGSSSSMKGCTGGSGKPFLRRHFSFGYKPNKSFSDNNGSRKKRFFWSKSSKE